MAVTVGTNSYVSLAEADEYFASRLDVAAWTEATSELRESALVTAAMALEQYTWVGVIADPVQALAWPRKGSYFDPRMGYTVALTDSVPERIRRAQMELAYHFLHNDGVLDSNGTVTEVQVGPIAVKGIQVASRTSAVAYQFISPLLANGGKRTWWRAN